MKHGAILLVTFNRPTELSMVMESVKRAKRDSIKKMLVVQQPGNSQISDMCTKVDWIDFELELNTPSGKTVASKINNNIFIGINLLFQDPDIEWVSVLEDDIVVSYDFFEFVNYIMKLYHSDQNFRGVNGFSGLPDNEINTPDQFGEYRYGFGWGWAINRNTWSLLQEIWSGNEEAHWDGHVEHLVKTGFVVMPIRSRILNIGFNERATHTKKYENSLLPEEEKLRESFVSTSYTGRYKRVVKDLDWREDCRSYLRSPASLRRLSQWVYRISYYFRPRHTDNNLQRGIYRIMQRSCEVVLRKLYSSGLNQSTKPTL
jgi:hypothetical protein